MFDFFPAWLQSPEPSTWSFTTSEAAEINALIFAGAKGSFYVQDSGDPDEIIHEILYVGAGLTMSQGLLPFGLGGSFSTPDAPSAGVGPIGQKPGRKLGLDDFGGTGLIIGASGGIGVGGTRTLVLFGIPPFTVAAGRMLGVQLMGPSIGFSAMPCIFTVDP